MHGLKSKELEVRGVLRWQRWMEKKKRRREQRRGLDFKWGGQNVEGI